MNQEKSVKVESGGSSLPVKHEQMLRLQARPVADIYETGDTFIVTLDLPGAEKESLQVTVEPGTLAVRGAIQPRSAASGRMIHREIGWNAYERSFKIGPGIDEQKISASFSDGVLTVILPKTEKAKPKQIEVQVQ